MEKARYDKMLGHEEIRAMITALGCGIGKDDFDATKLRYGKLILMTDADVDGSHIRTLLLTFFFRHMTELIKRGHVYIAQPPLFKIKKGKFEQYIKDEREYVQVMVKRASDGMVLRYGDGGAKIEGAALTKFMSQLNDYLGFFDKVEKRLRNEEVTEAFAQIFAQEGKDSARRVDFESPAKLKEMQRAAEGAGEAVPVPRGQRGAASTRSTRPTRSALPTRRARCARSTGRWPRPRRAGRCWPSTRS